jgi:hypothetical protein
MSIIKSCCTIIPLHSPKFEFGLRFLESANKLANLDHDFYFVFTNEQEYSAFKSLSNYKFKHIILPPQLLLFTSIVTIKKFYALSILVNEYKYFGVFDSEVVVVKPVNLNDMYSDIFNCKKLKCNISHNGSNLIKNAYEKLQLSDKSNKMEQIIRGKYYWWFNEIPVYESESVKRFLSHLNNLNNLNEIQNDYWCFDYILYGIWLLIMEDFDIQKIDVTSEWGVVEDNRIVQEEKDKLTSLFNSFWETNSKNHHSYDKIKLILHVDTHGRG